MQDLATSDVAPREQMHKSARLTARHQAALPDIVDHAVGNSSPPGSANTQPVTPNPRRSPAPAGTGGDTSQAVLSPLFNEDQDVPTSLAAPPSPEADPALELNEETGINTGISPEPK